MVTLVLLEVLEPRDQLEPVDQLDPLELMVARCVIFVALSGSSEFRCGFATLK